MARIDEALCAKLKRENEFWIGEKVFRINAFVFEGDALTFEFSFLFLGEVRVAGVSF